MFANRRMSASHFQSIPQLLEFARGSTASNISCNAYAGCENRKNMKSKVHKHCKQTLVGQPDRTYSWGQQSVSKIGQNTPHTATPQPGQRCGSQCLVYNRMRAPV